RTGRPARNSSATASSDASSHGQFEPAGNGFGSSPQVPAIVTLPSRSQRKIWTSRGLSVSPTSREIAANTSAEGAPIDTSVAILRSDACGSAPDTPGLYGSLPGVSGVYAAQVREHLGDVTLHLAGRQRLQRRARGGCQGGERAGALAPREHPQRDLRVQRA